MYVVECCSCTPHSPCPVQFSNEYSSYVLHNNALDPILAKQKKDDQKRMQEMMTQGSAPRAKGKKGEGIGDMRGW